MLEEKSKDADDIRSADSKAKSFYRFKQNQLWSYLLTLTSPIRVAMASQTSTKRGLGPKICVKFRALHLFYEKLIFLNAFWVIKKPSHLNKPLLRLFQKLIEFTLQIQICEEQWLLNKKHNFQGISESVTNQFSSVPTGCEKNGTLPHEFTPFQTILTRIFKILTVTVNSHLSKNNFLFTCSVSNIKNCSVKQSKRGLNCQGGGQFFCSHPVDATIWHLNQI